MSVIRTCSPALHVRYIGISSCNKRSKFTTPDSMRASRQQARQIHHLQPGFLLWEPAVEVCETAC